MYLTKVKCLYVSTRLKEQPKYKFRKSVAVIRIVVAIKIIVLVLRIEGLLVQESIYPHDFPWGEHHRDLEIPVSIARVFCLHLFGLIVCIDVHVDDRAPTTAFGL